MGESSLFRDSNIKNSKSSKTPLLLLLALPTSPKNHTYIHTYIPSNNFVSSGSSSSAPIPATTTTTSVGNLPSPLLHTTPFSTTPAQITTGSSSIGSSSTATHTKTNSFSNVRRATFKHKSFNQPELLITGSSSTSSSGGDGSSSSSSSVSIEMGILFFLESMITSNNNNSKANNNLVMMSSNNSSELLVCAQNISDLLKEYLNSQNPYAILSALR